MRATELTRGRGDASEHINLWKRGPSDESTPIAVLPL